MIATMPSTPANRPIYSPGDLSIAEKRIRSISGSADDAKNQRRNTLWRLRGDFVTGANQRLSLHKHGIGIVMDCRQRLALFDAGAHPLVELQADGVVDPVFFGGPATTENGQRGSE